MRYSERASALLVYRQAANRGLQRLRFALAMFRSGSLPADRASKAGKWGNL